jgi:hypothetical protein
MQLARLQHDRFVERLVVPPVALADEYPQQHGFMGQVHIKRMG